MRVQVRDFVGDCVACVDVAAARVRRGTRLTFARGALVAGLTLVAAEARAQQLAPDVILLRDGGRVRGEVMEETPDAISVVLADGTTEIVPRDSIREIRRGGVTAAPPAPPEAMAPTDQPAVEDSGGGGLSLAGAIVLAVGGAAAMGGGIVISSAVMDGQSDGRIPAGIGLAAGGGAVAVVGIVLMAIGSSDSDAARAMQPRSSALVF